jgi:hypothetical protein
LNSDAGIEAFNKIYLPFSSSSQLEVNKARVITANGKVSELKEGDILTAADEETGRQYKYFAFEGIEKGSFIEYYYVVKKYPEYQGKKISFQNSIEKSNIEFDHYSPDNLIFKFKSYNNLPPVVKDTSTIGKNHYKLRIPTLKKLENEDQSAYNALRSSLVYKLDQNLSNNTKEITSYGKVAQNIYSFYYPDFSKKTTKNLDKFILKATGSAKDEESLIRDLEFFIKTKVYVSEGNANDLEDLDVVMEKMVANETGLVKLYAAALRSLGIKHEIVLTSDRQELKFDKDFEANNFLTDFLIYFPKNKTYLSPKESSSRYGFPPANFTDNYGLFIKEMTVGNLTSGVGKVQYISPVGADKTFDNMVIDVNFEKEDISNINVKLDRSLNGYYAMYIQPYIQNAGEKNKNELIESFARNLNEDVEIIDKKMVNGDPKLFGLKPLQFVIDFKSDAFVEKAGNKYLFKVGELIGQQIQLYQEKERVLPLEDEFNRSYFRTININIPEGYKVVNQDDLNIDKSYEINGKELLSFNSSYKMEGNTLVIKADEHYRINIIETDIYEEYRTIINSAADFNKITLVLEPIK